MIAHLRNRGLRVLVLSLFVWLFGFGLYDQFLPIHALNLGASPAQLGLMFAAGQLFLGLGSLLGGVLTDRYNRRGVMLASWFLGAIVPLVYAAAPSWPWLFVGLAAYQLSVLGVPDINAYVAASVDRRALASAFALVALASPLGRVVAPALGGLLADRIDIRATFVLGFAAYTLSTLIVLRLPHVASAPTAGPHGPFDLRPITRYGGLLVFTAVASITPYLALPFISPYLRDVRGASLTTIGVLYSIGFASSLALAPVFGRLGDAIGKRRAIAGALAVEAAGHTLLVTAPAGALAGAFALRPQNPPRFLSEAWISEVIPPHLMGRAFGLYGLLEGLLAAGAAALGGITYEARPSLLFFGVAALALASAAVAWVGPRSDRR